MARPITLFTGQWADLSLDDLAARCAPWGYDGLELACWGDHFEVDRAIAEPDYAAGRRGASGRWRRSSWARRYAPRPPPATRASCHPRSGATGTPRASAAAPPSG